MTIRKLLCLFVLAIVPLATIAGCTGPADTGSKTGTSGTTGADGNTTSK